MSRGDYRTEVDDSRQNRIKEEPRRNGDDTARSNVVIKEEPNRSRVKREPRDGDHDLYQGYDQVWSSRVPHLYLV